MTIHLRPSLDVAALAEAFAARGRLHIPDILDAASAAALHQAIQAERQWNFTIFAHGKNMDLDAEGWRQLGPTQRSTSEQIVYERANHEFAYMHYKLSLYDRHHADALSGGLARAFEFLNGEAFLGFARKLTGAADIAFADAQLTAFGPGHFITVHDDDLPEKNRRAAYVLNMTPDWREDWGGYLNFFDDAGHVVDGFKPAFNALNIFRVPMRHAVGIVSPSSRAPRLAISGWLRAGEDPLRAR